MDLQNLEHTFSSTLKKSKGDISVTSNDEFPLYMPYPIVGCIHWFPNQLIIATGGGGPTKSGIANGFEILKFIKKADIQELKIAEEEEFEYQLIRDSWYNTGADIVHCIAQHPKYKFQFIAAVANSIAIMEMNSTFNCKQTPFEFQWKNEESKIEMIENTIIQTLCTKHEINKRSLEYESDPKTVNAIAIHPSGKLIASGGTDGIVRLWTYDFISMKIEKATLHEIDINQSHYDFLQSQSIITDIFPIAIEKLLFDNTFGDDSVLLSINNRECRCYIWNIEKCRMEIILSEKRYPNKYIFRDCAFISTVDTNHMSVNNNDSCLKFCICAVNTKRTNKKRTSYFKSYLYQYFVGADAESKRNDEWHRTNYICVENASVMRMICCEKTCNVITLHTNGFICVTDALNLTKKYSFKNYGTFFVDIALSTNNFDHRIGQKEAEHMSLQGNKEDRYLLIALIKAVIIKPLKLEKCLLNSELKHRSGVCHFFCNIWIFSTVILIIALLTNVGTIQ